MRSPDHLPAPVANAPYRFGRIDVQPTERRVVIDGEPAPLGARAFDLLLSLVERRERVVSKNELLDLVWPGIVVEENNLQVHVSALRKLLGPQAIATIPGRGYRFTLVESDRAPEPTPAQSDSPPRPAPAQIQARAPTNLPARLPELFGRADDVRTVRALLAAEPLVSIVGAGGIGKTRLALAVGSECHTNDVDGAFRDGVWWVELAALSDPAMVPSAVAQVLGVSRSSERPLADTLVTVLREQRLLLVLDNCEHLLEAVATLVETLLRSCPGVRVLLTSQEPTRLPEERAHRLASLAVPAASEPADAQAGAVALFVARAQAADRRLRFDEAAVTNIVEICRALDGIPLAIELAAARVPLLGLEGLRERLHERLNVLTGGSRLVLRRHQTLRAALEWSHGLLDDDQRVVFRRLAVFAGGFSLPLAQAIAADERIDRWAVLDLLGHLVDKSLVTIDAQDGLAGPRYRLLETTRAYAFEQLGAAGETPALLRRHAEGLYELLRGLHPTRWSHDGPTRARATAELDNLRAALSWAAAPGGDAALGHALIGVSVIVWSGNNLVEGLENHLRLPAAELPPELEAMSQLALALLGYLGARPDCYRAAERAANLFETLGDDDHRVDALATLVMIGSRRSEGAACEAALQTIDRLVGPHWPARQRASVALAHSCYCGMRDDTPGALAASWRQHACYAEDPHAHVGQLLAESNIAIHECTLGDYSQGIARHERVFTEFQRLFGPGREPGLAWSGLALALLKRNGPGDLQRSIETWRDGWALLRRQQEGTGSLLSLAVAQARRGAASNAVRLLGYAEAQLQTEGSADRVWMRDRQNEVRALRERVGAEQFDAWYAAGQTLDESAATKLAFALD